MSYIGRSQGFGIRSRFYYTATASQTTFSGADDNGQTLAYADSKYLDVYLNGVLLVAGTDYTATTLTSVSLTSGAAADDIIEIVAYDIFSVADTVSAANGGTFNGAVTVDSTLTASGLVTAQDGLVVDNDGATVATFDRATSDGDIVDLQKDGSSVGSIGARSGVLFIQGTNSTTAGLKMSDGAVRPCDSDGSNSDNDTDLGTSGTRFKDLYLSGGVYLGGTGAANYLDDYEEGTWTPTIGGSTSDPTYTTSTVTGAYTIVGQLCYISFLIIVTGVTGQGSGNIRIEGLPVTTTDTSYNAVVNIMYNDTFNNNYRSGYATGTTIQLRPVGVTQGNAAWASDTLTTGYLSGSGIFRI